MAPWNRELIELLPGGMKVMASAGAGFDWVDTGCLGEHGTWIPSAGEEQVHSELSHHETGPSGVRESGE